MSARPRSNSVTDAFRLRTDFRALPREENPILALAARKQAAEERNAGYISSLPKLTEKDVATLQLSDSSCPVCIVPFMAILSEEEMALAMDSPAYAAEELGVTKLDKTCGHVFCRKDIKNWLVSGHNSCPACRRPLMAVEPGLADAPGRLEDLLLATQESIRDIELITADMVGVNARLGELDSALSQANGAFDRLLARYAQSEPDPNPSHRDDHDDDRGGFSGMYS